MRKPKTTIFEEPAGQTTEAAKARWWRERIMQITREELASRTGYSVDAIDCFERGYNSDGKLLRPKAWKRYRMACGAVASAKHFDWVIVSAYQPEHQTRDQDADGNDHQEATG
jgi:hypothetical protein